MKKETLKDSLKHLESELAKDEGAWLKSLGELGDLARLLLQLQERHRENEQAVRDLRIECAVLRARIKNLEGGRK